MTQFGDWYLAWWRHTIPGAGTASNLRHRKRTGYADFWELYRRNALCLLRKLRTYVPIILALTLISGDPARYGIQVDPEPPLKADAIKPGQPIDFQDWSP